MISRNLPHAVDRCRGAAAARQLAIIGTTPAVRVVCVTSSLVNAIFNGERIKCGSESMNFLVRRAASASAVRMSASLRFVASPLVSPFCLTPNRVAHDLL